MMNIQNRNEINLKGKHVSVIGAARTGLAVSELVSFLGGTVFLSDQKNLTETAETAISKNPNITVEFNGHTEKVHDADLMVISPGVPQDADIILTAINKGLPVVTEIEFASWFTEDPIVAVTGTNGKTTTSTLIHKILEKGGNNSIFAGNVGHPFSTALLDSLENPAENTVYVLEISSFQMEHILHFKPDFAVLLNLSPDHLDRYNSFEDYVDAKLNILKNLEQTDTVVFNFDDKQLADRIKTNAICVPFSLKHSDSTLFSLNETKIYDNAQDVLVYLNDIKLPGKHNLENLMAASTVGSLFHVENNQIQKVLTSFKGVPHRIEHVRTVNGVEYYNDSKATTVESVKVAINSFPHNSIILIMGGLDKGADFSELTPIAEKSVKKVICFGRAKAKIFDSMFEKIHCIECDSLESSVKIANELAKSSDVVLLSPGCASFDMFNDFEHRGNTFKTIVSQLNLDK
tara:strand:- start:6962 stop:8344 length:1383 start_codon:yes stop_codon:yes gene_type:complete